MLLAGSDMALTLMLLTRSDMAITLMNSWQLWLPAQDYTASSHFKFSIDKNGALQVPSFTEELLAIDSLWRQKIGHDW